MEPDKNTSETAETNEQTPDSATQAPVDALSMTPDELADEQAKETASANASGVGSQPTEKKVSPIKRLFRRMNLYFLLFLLLLVIAGAFAAVTYLNSQKEPPATEIVPQTLTQDALKELANTDATVGNTNQTLTIQGNAIIAGQTLLRGNLNVAGNIQSGGSVTAPTITISGAANLGQAQISSLQVAQNVAIQGTTTLRNLNVSGTTSLSGAVTASQITVTKLILSGNASLEVPNHISFPGASPGRTINTSVLGNGGSASVNGSDTTGTVNINTGSSPQIGCFVTITFRQSFTNQPHVLVSPIGSAAGKTAYYVTRGTTSFSICTTNTAPANQTFGFDYFVTN